MKRNLVFDKHPNVETFGLLLVDDGDINLQGGSFKPTLLCGDFSILSLSGFFPNPYLLDKASLTSLCLWPEGSV